MADNFFKIRNGISLGSLASPPPNPVNGDIYFDTTLGMFQGYQGGTWGPLGSGGGSGITLPSEFFASSQVTTASTGINVSTFTTFSNSPAFSVTPTVSGKYRIFSSLPFYMDSVNTIGAARIINTSGGATLLYESQTAIYGSASAVVSSQVAMSVYQLTAGNTYVFDIQGKSLSGAANVFARGDLASFYMFAELTSIVGDVLPAVIMKAIGDPGSTSANTPLIYPTVSYDTNSGYNNTTGQYTAPLAGFYSIEGAVLAGSTYTVNIYKNNLFDSVIGYGSTGGGGSSAFSGTVQCAVGDVIDVRPGSNITGTAAGSLSISYLGSSTPPVAQYQFIGSAYLDLAASLTNSNSSLSAFTPAGSGTPAIELNPGPGTIQATAISVPQFTVNGLLAGTYKVRMSVTGNTNNNAALAINDGTTTSGLVGFDGGQNKRYELEGFFKYTAASSNITFQLWGSGGSGTVTIYAISSFSAGWVIGFSIERVGN